MERVAIVMRVANKKSVGVAFVPISPSYMLQLQRPLLFLPPFFWTNKVGPR